ncbi:hypothetical protein [Plasmodium yoelii yoelii]|uniref:Uncharacterized protein n=1 Tax=Plasmodium yoelii yoelii TaxID=73239 RepID=Q7RL30_PLAYO|nr:hypothetical protein [Plasmodium yoelii yoelii]
MAYLLSPLMGPQKMRGKNGGKKWREKMGGKNGGKK